MKHLLKTIVVALAICPWAAAQDAPPAAPAARAPATVLADAAYRSPAVAAVLDSPREKPADVLAAVLTLINLREYAVAAEVFKPVIEAKLSASDQAALVQQFGTAKFLFLARESGEHAIVGGREFAEAALAASATEAAKPEHLTQLIGELGSADPSVRQAARNDLAATGTPAAQACLEALAAATDKQQRSELLGALAEMGPVVDPLIVAALANGQGQFRRDVVELAGHQHLLEGLPWIATIASGGDSDSDVVSTAQAALAKMGLSVPNQDEARALVKQELDKIDAGIPTDSMPNETGPWWSFDPATKKFASRELVSCERRSLIHARLARNYLKLASATSAERQLAIISALEAAHVLGEQPSAEITKLAKGLEVYDLNAALEAALKTNRIHAAIVCTHLLADRADAAAIQSLDGSPSALVAAAAHPNLELKFAALAAIMKIHPTASYAGSSEVPNALWTLAAGSGTEQALVGAPSVAHATEWAGNLRSLGYDANPAATGIELIQEAIVAPRLGLILVDSDIGLPLVREVIYQLRAQPKLGRTPIAVLCANEDLYLGEQLSRNDKRLLAVSRPTTPEAMKSLVDRVLEFSDTQLTADERTAHAVQAIEWVGQLFAEGAHYDELQRDSGILDQLVYDPTLTKVTLQALANVGTASSQQTLVDFASLESQPMELRQLAVEAFATSRERFGVLLTAAEIATLYDRYNASETASEDIQKLFGQILDVLEKKSH